MYDRGHDNYAGAWIFMGGLMFLLVAAAVVVAVVLLTRRSREQAGVTQSVGAAGAPVAYRPAGAASQGPSPLEVLDLRLARGEIELEAYRSLRAELTRSEQTPPA